MRIIVYNGEVFEAKVSPSNEHSCCDYCELKETVVCGQVECVKYDRETGCIHKYVKINDVKFIN